MPVPSDLPRRMTSPGFAPALLRTRLGWTRPVTASPYFGSRSSTLWPPTIGQSAFRATSAPPARISPSSSKGCERGQPTMFRAYSGVPPIAYTSDSEFAAAIWP